jgi:hypothetical protein
LYLIQHIQTLLQKMIYNLRSLKVL